MSEYIERQLAENELGKAMPRLETPDGRGERDYEIEIAQAAFVDAIGVIQRLPAADVAPVVRGHWEVEKEDWGFCEAIGRNHVHRKFRCSVCGYETGDQAEKFKCCPICTALMGGD